MQGKKLQKEPDSLLRFMLVVVISLVVAFGAAGFAFLHHNENADPTIDFSLINHANIETTGQDILGNWALVYFGFTSCAHVCPLQMNVMSKALLELDKTGDSAFLTPIFITVDPERDTPEVLREYVARFDDRIVGLTGSLHEIKSALSTFNAFSAIAIDDDDNLNYEVIHPDLFYLVGPDGTLRQHYSSDQSYLQLAMNIRSEMRPKHEKRS